MADTDRDFDAMLRELARAPEVAPGQLSGSDDDWMQFGVSVGARIADRYVVRGALGRGGMGAVFEAVDERSGRFVAIKVLRPDLAADSVARERFRREALAAAQVRHPSIVEILESGICDDRAFLVMERLEGETLRGLLRRERTVPLARAIELLDPVLSALSAAHARGVVHRDVKPDNIFVLSRRPGDQAPAAVKILDFGIAKFAEQGFARLTTSQTAFGTAAYIAPEQARMSRDAGPAADQYAAAVVLFEALTGELPHTAASYPDMVLAKVTQSPRSLAELRPGLPVAVCDAVMRALDVVPERRFVDVAAFRGALAAFALPGGARP